VDWLNLGDDPRAEPVKSNYARRVWRIDLSGRLLFAKINTLPRGGVRWLRSLISDDSNGERRRGEYAYRHGINAVIPVASGKAALKNRKSVSILLTIGLEGVRPLSDFWLSLKPAEPGTRMVKNHVVEAVARLMACAHQRGFQHLDLHPGNILVLPGPQGDYQALFVDLHNVRVGRPVKDRQATHNLAQLNQWFYVRGLLSDRIRFLNRYLYWREIFHEGAFARRLGLDRRQLLRRLERDANRHANALYAKRDRRALRDGRYFARLILQSGWRAHVFLRSKEPSPGSRATQFELSRQQWREWLANPLGLLRTDDPQRVIKESATAIVCRVSLPLPHGEALDVVCKHASARNFLKRFQNSFRTSRPMLTWKRAHALLNRRIPTARPLAVVEKKLFGLRLDSLIITDLQTILSARIKELPLDRQRQFKRMITEALVAVLRRFHDCGFMHRDLKAQNIIVQWSGKPGEVPRILLVDLDGIRRPRRYRHRAWMRALMRLNVSLDHCPQITRTDRLRFLKRYLERPGFSSRTWKPVWRDRNHRRSNNSVECSSKTSL